MNFCSASGTLKASTNSIAEDSGFEVQSPPDKLGTRVSFVSHPIFLNPFNPKNDDSKFSLFTGGDIVNISNIFPGFNLDTRWLYSRIFLPPES